MSNEEPIRVDYRCDYIMSHPNFTGCLIDEDEDIGKFWYLNGMYHRENGPAVELTDGYKAWWLNGKRHRTDGPAVEYTDGSKQWWLNGQQLAEQEHRRIVRRMKLKMLVDTDQHSL
jgi:hypothetical protein